MKYVIFKKMAGKWFPLEQPNALDIMVSTENMNKEVQVDKKAVELIQELRTMGWNLLYNSTFVLIFAKEFDNENYIQGYIDISRLKTDLNEIIKE